MEAEPPIFYQAMRRDRAAPGAGAGPHDSFQAQSAEHVAALESELRLFRQMYGESRAALVLVQSSRSYKVLRRLYELRDRLLPDGSLRKRIVTRLYHRVVRLGEVSRLALRRAAAGTASDPYRIWIKNNEPDQAELERQRTARFSHRLTISLAAAVHGTAPADLGAVLRSVREQTYAGWELCLAAVAPSPEARALLEAAGREDSRVKAVFLPDGNGTAAGLAAAMALADGDFVGLLDPADTLAPFALYEAARAADDDPDIDVLYSDEDRIDAGGTRRTDPLFKADWSPDTLLGRNYVGRLALYRRELLEQVGGPRPGFDGAEDYDLILRASTRARKIHHIPKVLYHRRGPGNAAAAFEAGRRALQDHLDRQRIRAAVRGDAEAGVYHAAFALPRRPLVSVIIPTRDQTGMLERCLASLARASYDRLEILPVENNSREPQTFQYYGGLQGRPGVRLLTWDHPFNYAALNNWAAGQARGEVLLFLNNDVEAINADWLERMLEHALRPEIGAAGAKLFFPDDTVQHAGVVLNLRGTAGHILVHAPRASRGYECRLISLQNYSAVTGACLMMRKEVFDEVGGFDEGLAVAYNDIDLCLMIRRKGYRIVLAPLAELYHHESATRGQDDTLRKAARYQRETAHFLAKWGEVVCKGDPYYSPNLSTANDSCSVRT